MRPTPSWAQRFRQIHAGLYAAGHPKYIVDSGQVLLDGEDILKMTPDERAKAGIFLAMQYPVEFRVCP